MLLGLPLLGTSVTCENKYAVKIQGRFVSIRKKKNTRSLLLLVGCDGTNDSILPTAEAVTSALDVTLGLRSFVLSLSGCMFLFARLLQTGGTSYVANRLDDVALGRMELTRDFAAKNNSKLRLVGKQDI